MATIIPETAPTSNYHVPDYLSRPAKKGTLRALGTSLSMQIGKISFKVSLKKHKDWISNHETFRHLERTSDYLIASSYIPDADVDADRPTLDPPYDALRALKNCEHQSINLLDLLKFMIITYNESTKPNQQALRARMIDKLTQMERQLVQIEKEQSVQNMFENSTLVSGDSISRSSSMELDEIDYVGGGGSGGGEGSSKSYGGSEDGGGGGSHKNFGDSTPPSTPSTPSASSSHKRKRPTEQFVEQWKQDMQKSINGMPRGSDAQWQLVQDLKRVYHDAGHTDIRGEKDQPDQALSYRSTGLIWTCVPNSEDDAEFAKQCHREEVELQVITGAEVFSGTIQELRTRLVSSQSTTDPIRWIHFIGHCSQRMPCGESVKLSLVNTDSDGRKEVMNEEDFVKIITSLEISNGEKLIKMISLNTCNSTLLAQKLFNADIAHVLSWDDFCRGEAVRIFATSYYIQWYRVGNSPQVAFETAKCALLAITTVKDVVERKGETKQGQKSNRHPKYKIGSLTAQNINESLPMVVGQPRLFPPPSGLRNSVLTSDENKRHIMSVLKNGVVPPLPSGCTHHFFISKDETFKETSILIATWLIGLGFSVWEFNLEKEHGRSLTPEAMQLGVQNAAVVVLLLTPGIFHIERHFVWKTEIKYALEECHKPLMVLKSPGFSGEKCNSTFATGVEMHYSESCNNTSGDYQPWIRAILRTPTRVTWKLSGTESKKAIILEFSKIHDRNYVEDPAFRAEINRQRELHLEHGACAGRTIRNIRLDPFAQRIANRVKELGQHFVGRDWLATATENEINKSNRDTDNETKETSTSAKQTVVVYGDSGTGKSAFFSRILDTKFCHDKGGSWLKLHNRVLARHICRVQDDDSLSPIKWVRSLAGQIFSIFSQNGKINTALEIWNHSDSDSFINWIESENSVRKILSEWVLPVLNTINDASELGGKCLIMIDSLDEALTIDVLHGDLKDTIVTFLLEFRKEWPSWIQFLVTSRPDVITKKKLNPLTGASIDVHDERNLKDIRDFVEHSLERGFRLGKQGSFQSTNQSLSRVLQCQELNELLDEKSRNTLANAPMCRNWHLFQPGTIDQICNKAAGVFMYAREVLSQLNDDPFLDLENLPLGLADLYMERFKRTFPSGTLAKFKKHSEPMLAMLVAARGPIPVNIVKNAGIDLTKKKTDGFKDFNAEHCRHLEFVQRMCVGSLVDVGMLQFSHKSFADWLEDGFDENESYCVDREDGEKMLAEECWNVLPVHVNSKQLDNMNMNQKKKKKKKKKRRRRGDKKIPEMKENEEENEETLMHSYALTHGVAHLVECNRKDDAKKLMLDVKYLLARGDDGVRLVEDCKRLQGDRTMEVLSSALGLSLGDMRKDPRRIVSQLVGRLMWSAGVGGEEKEKEDEKNETKTATKRNGNIKNKVENEIQDLRNRLMEYEYDFDWWGVTSRTMEQAGGACVRQLLGHEGYVESVDYSSDIRFVVSGSLDNTVRIWDVDTGECVKILRGHTDNVFGVSFSPNNQYVVSGSGDKTVRIWDVESGDCIKTLKGHTGDVNDVSFSPNNQYVVSGSGDNTVRIWDLESGDCIKTLEGHTDYVRGVSFSPNNQYVVSGSNDKTVRIWDVESGDCIKTLEGHTNMVMGVSFSPNNQYVVSGSIDKTVRIWDMESGDCVKTLEGHTSPVYGVSFSPNDQYVVSGSSDKTIRIWDVESGDCIKTLEGHTHWVNGVSFSPNNQYVVSGSSDKTVRIWDVESGDCIKTLEGHTGRVLGVSFSPNNQSVVSGSWDKTVRIWDVDTGECVKILKGHTNYVRGVSFSPNNQYVVSGSDDKTVRIWDVESGDCIKTLEGHTGPVYGVSFSPNDQYVVSGSNDKTVRIWDVESGDCIKTLEGHTSSVNGVSFSPNNQYVLSCDYGGDQRIIWSVSTGECLHVIKYREPLPSEYQSHFTNKSTSTDKIDLSLFLKDSTIVGLENGKDAIGTSNGMNAAAKESSTVHHFTLHFSNKERRVAYENKQDKKKEDND
jgi:WD40 repeat protein